MSQSACDFSTIEDRLLSRQNIAAIIVYNKHRVLVSKRGSGKKFLPNTWHFPGGKKENGESDTVTLKRELSEELNISNIRNITNLNVFHTYNIGSEIHRTKFYCCMTGDTPSLNNSENSELAVVDVSELAKYITDKTSIINVIAAKKAVKLMKEIR